jgi:hypothetical protein
MSCHIVERESPWVMGYIVPPLHQTSKTTIAAALTTITTLKMELGPQSTRKSLLIPSGGPGARSLCLRMPCIPLEFLCRLSTWRYSIYINNILLQWLNIMFFFVQRKENEIMN